jgi:hypothetical protein
MDVTLKGLRKALEQAAAKPGAPFKKARITTFFENPVVTRALEAMLAQRAIRKMRATVQIVSTARDLFDAHKALAVEVSAEDAKAIDKLDDKVCNIAEGRHLYVITSTKVGDDLVNVYTFDAKVARPGVQAGGWLKPHPSGVLEADEIFDLEDLQEKAKQAAADYAAINTDEAKAAFAALTHRERAVADGARRAKSSRASETARAVKDHIATQAMLRRLETAALQAIARIDAEPRTIVPSQVADLVRDIVKSMGKGRGSYIVEPAFALLAGVGMVTLDPATRAGGDTLFFSLDQFFDALVRSYGDPWVHISKGDGPVVCGTSSTVSFGPPEFKEITADGVNAFLRHDQATLGKRGGSLTIADTEARKLARYSKSDESLVAIVGDTVTAQASKAKAFTTFKLLSSATQPIYYAALSSFLPFADAATGPISIETFSRTLPAIVGKGPRDSEPEKDQTIFCTASAVGPYYVHGILPQFQKNEAIRDAKALYAKAERLRSVAPTAKIGGDACVVVPVGGFSVDGLAGSSAIKATFSSKKFASLFISMSQGSVSPATIGVRDGYFFIFGLASANGVMTFGRAIEAAVETAGFRVLERWEPKLLSDIEKIGPLVTVTADASTAGITFTGASGTFTLDTAEPQDMMERSSAELREIRKGADVLNIKSTTALRAFDLIKHAASDDESRPGISRVYVHALPSKKFGAWATNGHILALWVEGRRMSDPLPDLSVLPYSAIATKGGPAIAAVLSGCPWAKASVPDHERGFDDYTWRTSAGSVSFTDGGRPPAFMRIVGPARDINGHIIYTEKQREEMLRGCQDLIKNLGDKRAMLTVRLVGDQMTMTHEPDRHDTDQSTTVVFSGRVQRVGSVHDFAHGVSPVNVAGALRSITGEVVFSADWGNNNGPTTYEGSTGDGVLFSLVMPMRL